MSGWDWPQIIAAVALSPVASLGFCLICHGPTGAFFAGWLRGCVIGMLTFGPWLHDPAWGTGSAISAAVCLIAWWLWWRRKDLKRALGWLGYKARALRDALVRRAREAARPRPVLRPVPGSSR